MTLWPLVEASRSGELGPVMFALGTVSAGVGSNLIAGEVQRWSGSAAREEEAAAWAADTASENPAVRDALDALLEKLETIARAQEALAQAHDARASFEAKLREELSVLGNLGRFEVVLAGGPSLSVGGSIDRSVVAIGSNINVRVGRVDAEPGPALARYREQLVREYGPLPLRGLDVRASDPSNGSAVGLADVYIDLDTTERVERHGTFGGGGASGIWHEAVTALEAARRERRLVLLGEPGSGKSTFMSFVALCLAAHGLRPGEGWLARLPGWDEGATLPLPVLLRDFVRRLPERLPRPEPRLLWDYIVARLEDRRLGDAAKPLEEALDQGDAVVLLDGLDEVRTDRERAVVRDAVAAFADRYARSRFVVSCRTLSYQDRAWALAGWPVSTLARFDGPKVRRFITVWYDELSRLGVVSNLESQALAAGLGAAVRRRGLGDLASNPLLLTQMALVHTHDGRLPDARAQLYEKTVDLLLWRWEGAKEQGESAAPGLRALLDVAHARDTDLLTVLWRLAFESHGARGGEGPSAADIPEARLEEALRELHPGKSKDWAFQVVAAMKLRAGLLLERAPRIYAFPHRTFQEYLAGCHLATQASFAQEALRLLGEGAFWREVVLLGVGRLASFGDTERPLFLASELCLEPEAADEASARRAWDAGEVLAEVGLQRLAGSELGRCVSRDVPMALKSVVERGFLRPVERAAAAEVLARLGDPRFRADAWNLPGEPTLGFVEIPEGPFRMGSDKKHDPAAGDDEKPGHDVTLRRYFIGRYPVTVAQFQAFVDDGGKVDDKDALGGASNYPVVSVSWREALAYAEWLNGKLKDWSGTPEPLASLLRKGTRGKPWCVSLPSEAEWEKAARGTDGRIYPWGNEAPDENRANHTGAELGPWSAVGCFRRGGSPFGVEELSGNVWEWTRSVYRKYPYDPVDGREDLTVAEETRAVRGGAFYRVGRIVRSAARYRLRPVIRYPYLGFRVVVVCPF